MRSIWPHRRHRHLQRWYPLVSSHRRCICPFSPVRRPRFLWLQGLGRQPREPRPFYYHVFIFIYIYCPFYHFFRAIFLIFTIVSGVGQSNMDGSIQREHAVTCPSRRLQHWNRLGHNPRGNFRSRAQRSSYSKSCAWRLWQFYVCRFVLQHRLPVSHVPCTPACQAPHWHLRFQRSLLIIAFLYYMAAANSSCLCKLLFLDFSINWHVFTVTVVSWVVVVLASAGRDAVVNGERCRHSLSMRSELQSRG